MNSIPLWAILICLLILLPASVYFGDIWARFSLRNNHKYLIDEAIPTSILGVHALILGFTFSMSVDHYENRRDLVVKESNAIGTAYLRSQMITGPLVQITKDWFVLYLKHQTSFSQASDSPSAILGQSALLKEQQDKIWSLTKELTRENRTAVDAIYIESLNSMFDVHNERVHSLINRLPIAVLFLLILTLVASLVCFGFVESSKKTGDTLWLYVLSLMFAVVICLVIDIDLPSQGLVSVPQLPIEELSKTIAK
jgi:ABC-type glycerol-3-phosphate transport system permease component